MKISVFLRKSAKKNDANIQATIYFRLRDKGKDFKVASKLTINSKHWNPEKEGYKDKIACISVERQHKLNHEIQSIRSFITHHYHENADKTWLHETLNRYYYLNKELTAPALKPSFQQLLDEFLLKHKLSEVRKKNFRVIFRAMIRYEAFVRTSNCGQKLYELDVDTITADTLHDMWDFFEREHLYYVQYPAFYAQMQKNYTPQPRGRNTLIDGFCRIRTFFRWCYEKKKTINRPFDQFRIDECTYGTPIYITLHERDRLFEKDFSHHPQLEIQRDIFIFQSLIGCRIGDLYRMTKRNIINDAIEYIPRKTKEGNPVTVRVPLNNKAKMILEKYKNKEINKLLPFISEQKYNKAIKKAFKLAEINRIVTLLDPLTNQEVKKPLYEVASSHMARRTFIGNIYKKVKDPNLIGALSGHKEGSKAFNRYREIDEEMKKELVKILD